MSAIVFETPPKLSELAPDAPEGLEFVLHRALEKDPARRLQNAGELKQAISLCRVAAQLSPIPAAPAAASPSVGEKTRVFQRPLAVPSAAPSDSDKTRVMPRAAAPPAAPMDDAKTKVMQRPLPAPLAPPPPPPPKLPPAAARSLPVPAQQLRYCPSCTFANPPHAAECERCQTPFSTVAYPTKAGSWPLYVAIAVAVLLAIALTVVLILK